MSTRKRLNKAKGAFCSYFSLAAIKAKAASMQAQPEQRKAKSCALGGKKVLVRPKRKHWG